MIEGKQVDPFRVAVGRQPVGGPRLSRRPIVRVPRRARLAYRDVASATNRLTLIAAIVPARAVTTHTLFCLRTPLPLPHQRVLCALLNSYVANYLIRLRVNTHVTVSLVSRLPVPVLQPDHPLFARLAACAEALALGAGPAEEMEEYAEIQAIAAHLYRPEPGPVRACAVDVSAGAERDPAESARQIHRPSLITNRGGSGGAEIAIMDGDTNYHRPDHSAARSKCIDTSGPGLLESVYESALCIEFKSELIPFKRQVGIPLYYKAS